MEVLVVLATGFILYRVYLNHLKKKLVRTVIDFSNDIFSFSDSVILARSKKDKLYTQSEVNDFIVDVISHLKDNDRHSIRNLVKLKLNLIGARGYIDGHIDRMMDVYDAFVFLAKNPSGYCTAETQNRKNEANKLIEGYTSWEDYLSNILEIYIPNSFGPSWDWRRIEKKYKHLLPEVYNPSSLEKEIIFKTSLEVLNNEFRAEYMLNRNVII